MNINESAAKVIRERYEQIVREEEKGKLKVIKYAKTFILFLLAFTFGLVIFLSGTIPAQEEVSAHNTEVLNQEEGRSYGKHKAFADKYKEEYDSGRYMAR